MKEDFVATVSTKTNELSKFFKSDSDLETKSLLVLAYDNHMDGSIGFCHYMCGASNVTVDSIVEFMKTNRGNIIWQAVRKIEQEKQKLKKQNNE